MFAVPPDEFAVMVQTADPVAYAEMLRVTSWPNRLFCARHGVRYASVSAVLRGHHPWQASYNRILLLDDLRRLDYRGWYLHLDADAYVHDRAFEIRPYLAERAAHAVIAAPSGALGGRWDVNNGVFFLNLGHPAGCEIVRRWRELLELHAPVHRLREAAVWGDVPDDQSMFHAVLRDDPALLDALLLEPADFMNAGRARFVRQVLRVHSRDPASRLRFIAAEVARSLAEGDDPAETSDVLLPALATLLGVSVPEAAALEAAASDRKALASLVAALAASDPAGPRAEGDEALAYVLPALARSLGLPAPDRAAMAAQWPGLDPLEAGCRVMIEARKHQLRDAAPAEEPDRIFTGLWALVKARREARRLARAAARANG